MKFGVSVLLFLVAAGCGREEPTPRSAGGSEADYQVRRLREDTEIELQDLRGRWLAAEGLLAKQRLTGRGLEQRLDHTDDHLERRLAELQLEAGTLRAELELLRASAHRPEPVQDHMIDRLASSYEEIYCLRKQGAEEAVAGVYRRYGFDSADEWASAWQSAARSEAFERRVATRVERLCP
ncbi:MAG: hypothetical protein ACI9WU_004594 [Myxococcota bacterium]|jgi:hypothetical protein